jgi:hypothetical protein
MAIGEFAAAALAMRGSLKTLTGEATVLVHAALPLSDSRATFRRVMPPTVSIHVTAKSWPTRVMAGRTASVAAGSLTSTSLPRPRSRSS